MWNGYPPNVKEDLIHVLYLRRDPSRRFHGVWDSVSRKWNGHLSPDVVADSYEYVGVCSKLTDDEVKKKVVEALVRSLNTLDDMDEPQ